MTSDGDHAYIYNAENQIAGVDSGSGNGYAYAYDDQRRRIKKWSGATGVWSHSIWEGAQVIAEYNHTGGLNVEYIYGGGKMVASVAGGATRYFLRDRLSIRASLDIYGNVVGRQGHLPFGEGIGTSGELDKHKFTTYERDAESGLDYAVNRSHSPDVGKFLQADPYRASGGKKLPQSWNRYSYTRNDPINSVDPLGLQDDTITIGVTACYAGGYPENYGGVCPATGGGAGGNRRSPLLDTGSEGETPSRGNQQLRKKLPQNRITGFRRFLRHKDNETCRQKLNKAYPGLIDQMDSAVAEVGFVDTNMIAADLASVYFPSTLLAHDIPLDSGVTVGEVFQPNFIPNQVIRAITEPKSSTLGQPGIYTPGGLNSPFFQGVAGNKNLQHELVHFITGDGDAELAQNLGISDGDVKGWFDRGCKNPDEK